MKELYSGWEEAMKNGAFGRQALFWNDAKEASFGDGIDGAYVNKLHGVYKGAYGKIFFIDSNGDIWENCKIVGDIPENWQWERML